MTKNSIKDKILAKAFPQRLMLCGCLGCMKDCPKFSMCDDFENNKEFCLYSDDMGNDYCWYYVEHKAEYECLTKEELEEMAKWD